jgi:hypothetical protein
MNEYVILAQQYMNPSDYESELVEWKVGTLEQAKFWYEKWTGEGYNVHVRKCTNPLNPEFVQALIDTAVVR